MGRNRLGKRERQRAAMAERAAIIASNSQAPKPERPVYGAPSGYRQSILARNTLKSASHTATFSGPRGYYTPKDTLSRHERVKPGERMGSLATPRRSQSEREEAQRLAATVKGWDKPSAK